jgi:hypothetical protein
VKKWCIYVASTQYSDPESMKKFPIDIELGKYVAAGVVVFDLSDRDIKFITSIHCYIALNLHSVDFDLTTDSSTYAGYTYHKEIILYLLAKILSANSCRL